MKLIHSLALAALFNCAIQADIPCSKKIPVTARKKDPKTDTKLITVKISYYQGSHDGALISGSNFAKNTSLRTNKLFFCFEHSDNNKIQVFDGKNFLFAADNAVSKVDGQYGAGLVIDTINKKIDIEYKKIKIPSIKATLMLPKNSGTWLVVSGNKDYSQPAAQIPLRNDKDVLTEEGILEWKKFASSKKNSIKIYKDQDVRIYVSNDKGVSKFNTLIPSVLVKEANKALLSSPVLKIDADGTATILSKEQYEKLPGAVVASSPAAATGASSSAAAGAVASQGPILLTTLKLEALPAQMDLKARLISKLDTSYESKKKSLVRGTLEEQQTAVKKLMLDKLSKTLIKAPYVVRALELAKTQPAAVGELIQKQITALQARYTAIYPVLMGQKQMDATIEAEIKTLRSDIDKALAK